MVTAHDMNPTELDFFLLICVMHEMGLPNDLSRGRLGWNNWPTGRSVPPFTSIQVNSEENGTLAKLVDILSTNYSDRYDKFCCHRGDNVLGPKSMAHIAKLKMAKAKELVGEVYTVELFLHKNNTNSPPKNERK
jgi:large subunit ribosomal protein L7Ae